MLRLTNFLRGLSGVLFLLALLSLAYLLASDLWSGFKPGSRHHQAESLALIFSGSSLITLQLGTARPWKETLKGILLGVAFVLWGGEQYLPAGSWATAVDSAVIAIFVVDLGLVIGSGLGRRVQRPG